MYEFYLTMNWPKDQLAELFYLPESFLYDINVAGISEIRFADDGQLTETTFGYTFFWKERPADETREQGVGFVIKHLWRKKKLAGTSFFGKSERIISLCISLQQRFVTIVSVNAPTMSSSESDKLSFYADPRQVFLSIPDSDENHSAYDLNTRVGNCLGSHGIGNANSNDYQLLQFSNEHDLVSGNTWYR